MAIPKKPSTHGGIPVTDVNSAQQAIHGLMSTPEEQAEQDLEQTEVTQETSEQATEVAESVETQAEDKPDTGELTAEDLVEDTQTEETETPDTYTIKVDGKDVEVTLEELKNGYSRQADYTRKSQVLAEQRQKADQELAATQQERQRYISQLEHVTKSADAQIQKYQNTDWDRLKTDNPEEYYAKRDEFRELKENKRKVEEERNKVIIKQQQETAKQWQETLTHQQEVLSKRLPEWNDPDKGPKLKQNIKNFALDKGFTEQEVNSLIDARSVDVLHKAMLYENLLATKISKKKTKVVPKVTKPGTGTTKGDVMSEKTAQLKRRAKSTGKVDDAAKLIESLMK
tara:strand:+ start:7652 stop:8677 length:1026 start_codon:yes stop_codon:yes gene_type:complete